jgi:hypothetical protein
MDSAAGVVPEERGSTNGERMQEHAHLARPGRHCAIPLTLLTQRTGPTTVNAGPLHQAQAAISFLAPFVNRQRLMGRTAQRASGLEKEVLPREPARLEGTLYNRLAIPARGRGLLVGGGPRRSKLGGAQRLGMQGMPQLQTQVPHPLKSGLRMPCRAACLGLHVVCMHTTCNPRQAARRCVLTSTL